MGEFSFVGALAISSGSANYKGSAVALSPEWVLTAGHNVDLDDDGLPDTTWSGSFHLPGYGSFAVTQAFTHPSFTAFANPAVNDDLALLHLAVALPVGLGFPTLGSGASIGDFITLVGFGRSGYGGRFGDTGGGRPTRIGSIKPPAFPKCRVRCCGCSRRCGSYGGGRNRIRKQEIDDFLEPRIQ